MCGICGVVNESSDFRVDPAGLTSMRDSMFHRGPDDEGLYVAPGVGLGSRRLAILDLSERGRMPMSTADGRYWIVYNGEVYNFRELRTNLETRGFRFRSGTDTEVLLYAYVLYGREMLNQLNGMFAIAIWDKEERTLFLARDRLGIKPLYYCDRGGTLYFASEEEALFDAGIPREFDNQAWEELLCFRYVAGERTAYSHVRRLLPGHYLVWRGGHYAIHRWWNYAERIRMFRDTPPRDPVEWFKATFDDAVRLRRISDVPVGVLLSGGLDSGSVAASLASQEPDSLASFTVRFTEPAYDEGPLANDVAVQWGLKPHELRLSPSELAGLLPVASQQNGAPLAHASDVHLLAISKYAKQHVTVLLSGEGADESLGGYVRYRPLRFPNLMRIGRHWPPARFGWMGRRMQKLSRMLALGSEEQFILYNACDVLPDDLRACGMQPTERFPFREQILAEAGKLYPRQPVRQAMFQDQHTFLCSLLDRNDRMTMGASMECRVPFLDYRLVEAVSGLPDSVLLSIRWNKRLLRAAVGSRLPAGILKHRKWGFGVPWSTYLRTTPQLRSLTQSLHKVRPICDGPFESRQLQKVTADFLRSDDRHWALVTQLVMIAVWFEACFQQRCAAAGERARVEVRSV